MQSMLGGVAAEKPAAAVNDRSRAWAERVPRVLVVGGCDVHLRIDLVRALMGRFDLVVAGTEREIGHLFINAGIDYRYYPLSRGATPARDLASLYRLYRVIRQVDPDIVHTYATKPNIWGRIAARMARVPGVIGTVPGLGSLYSQPEDRVRHRVVRRIYEGLQQVATEAAHVTIFQHEGDRGHFCATGIASRERSLVVPGSGVRTEYFDPDHVSAAERIHMKHELQSAARGLVITMVARLIRTKGVLEFAAAAERQSSRDASIQFVLVGPDDAGSIDHLSDRDRARVERYVRWLGPRNDIRAILSATDVFVLPTYYREGIPRVLLEAASMGLPLVTTRTSGCTEVVVEGENGFLVPPRDALALSDAIERLTKDPELRTRFGAESRQRACRMFDVGVIANHTAAIYDNVFWATRGRGRWESKIMTAAREARESGIEPRTIV